VTTHQNERDAGEVWETPCPRCRYDTRGLPTDRCPECGLTRYDARKILRDAPREATTAALSTIIAIGAFLLAGVTLLSAHEHGFRGDTERCRTIGLVGCLGALLALGLINLTREHRGHPQISLWWFGLLVVLLLFLVPP
jgi:hypothetical protein